MKRLDPCPIFANPRLPVFALEQVQKLLKILASRFLFLQSPTELPFRQKLCRQVQPLKRRQAACSTEPLAEVNSPESDSKRLPTPTCEEKALPTLRSDQPDFFDLPGLEESRAVTCFRSG